ncbi:MAG: hypothetical protein DA408_00770 [Bacteroidetes bacterium]|nr:MAG: hypothetical protein C7N36_14350 [Bacteroidota bacterium]PTM15184.1 MAG: hypothetical protein DA408_00770 [Bacteroidota bacterium]
MKLLLATLKTGLLLGIFVCAACSSNNEEQEAALLGRWEIQEAFRSGEVTTTLAGMFFEFEPDGQLLTNIAGSDENYAYELDGDHILQREGTIEADYAIEELADNRLVLTTNLGNKPFRIVLKKKME